jgi:hypothetical protein
MIQRLQTIKSTTKKRKRKPNQKQFCHPQAIPNLKHTLLLPIFPIKAKHISKEKKYEKRLET